MKIRAGLLAAVTLLAAALLWRFQRGRAPDLAPVEEALLAGDPLILGCTPDGAQLLLLSQRGDRFRLLLRERASGSERVLDEGPVPQRGATFSPDGTALAFAVDSGAQQQELILVRLSRPGRERLLAAPGSLSRLSFSPDGTRLAFVHAGGGRRELAALDLASGRAALALEALSARSGYAFGPDGRLAAVQAGREDRVVLTRPGLAGGAGPAGPGASREEVAAPEGSRVRGLDWSGDGRTLAISALLRGEDRASLHRLTLGQQWVRLSRGEGDFVSPRLVPGSTDVIASVADDGGSALVRCGDAGCAPLGPRDGSAAGTRFSPDGRFFYFVHTSPASPPSLFAALLHEGAVEPRSAPARAAGTAPLRVDLSSKDGTKVPAYVWRSPGARAALIRVHGGPDLQLSRSWDAGTELLVRSGVHVIAPNYRGSSGYGDAFEGRGADVQGQVDDLAAACAYATGVLGVPLERVLLLGDSYGAPLALEAAGREECRVRALMLLAMTRPRAPLSVPPVRVLAFHGELDPTPPAEARRLIEAALGGAGEVRFTVLAGEGHSFHRLSSWAQVYGGLLGLSPP